MTYVIVNIERVNDHDAFREYADRVAPLIERHGGKYLAIERTPEVKSGEWPYARTVIVAFPSLEAARGWYDSPEYQELLSVRLKAITANIAFVRDLSEAPILKAASQ
ncbi:MAG: DUF1330 domain-containing protein [Terriglobales bacterium]